MKKLNSQTVSANEFAPRPAFRATSLILALAAIGLASLPATDAFANPQGGQVVAGSASIRQETAAKVGVTQTTDKAIIDWQKYSIGANEHVQYYQPSASSVTLNRVVGHDPSQILGRLTANGQVFLVNPNGIFFGKNAQIDVAGLVASTHNIRNEDFLAGKYNFNIPGNPGAAVINEGAIRIADTGIAAFVAPSVANRGVIVAKLGKVMLASANGFTLDFTGDQLLTFLVSDEVAKTAFDLEGKQLTSFVENSGRIEAHGGYVLLTAKAAENAIHGVINQSGVIEATTVGTHNGEIILNAGKRSLSVSGTLDASAPNGGDGGFIETSGGHVAIDPSTKITTAAPFGKTGHWLIDPTDYTVAASGGDITGAVLSSRLANNNVSILSSGGAQAGNGDIFVNDVIYWNANTTLTLSAFRDITVNANITATGNLAGLTMAPGTGGSGHFYMASITRDKKITLSGSNPILTIAGQNYTVINSLAALQTMNNDLTGRYALGSDINAADTATWNGGQGFVPIGNFTDRFTGFFDGLGHSISNLRINRPAEDYVALFGVTSNGADQVNIGNVRLSGGSITGRNTVGSLVGGGGFGWINNVASSVAVAGNSVAGGLVGQQDVGRITDSYATGAVTGSATPLTYVGGLVGVNNGPISRSFATGEVRGDQYVGGLVGYNASAASTISDSYASGDVYGKYRVGGLVGTNNTGVTIERSMAYGAIHDIGTIHDRIGGLVGRNTGNVVDSYWEISKYAVSQGGTGLSTAAMKQQTNFPNWDFTSVWRIDEGASYPYLAWTVVATASSTSTGTETSSSARTDVCQVAPQTCVTRYERTEPRADREKSRLDQLLDQVNGIDWAQHTDKAIGPGVQMFYIGMVRLLANDRLKQILGTEMAVHFQNILKANLINVLKRIKANPTRLGFNMLLNLVIDDLKAQIGADGDSSSFAAVYKDLLVDVVKETLNTAYDAAVAGKSPATFQLALATSATIRISAFTAQKAFKVGQSLAKLSDENKRVVAESSDSLYYFIQSQSKADLANVSGHPDQAAKHNQNAAQLVDRTTGNLAATFGFDRAATTAVLRAMAEASKLAATGDMDGARARVQAALDIAKKEDGLVTAPWSISMEDYVRNMESAWVRVL